MRVAKDAYVAIHYTLTDDQGVVVDKSQPDTPLGFVFGHQQIIPGLEKALEGKQAAEKFSVRIAPEDGYGAVNQELYQEVPKSNFPSPETLEVGQQFQAHTPHGPMPFAVHEVRDDVVVVDLNHPLAGQYLNFDVEVAEVRPATQEELAQVAHPHCGGSGGCSSCG